MTVKNVFVGDMIGKRARDQGLSREESKSTRKWLFNETVHVVH